MLPVAVVKVIDDEFKKEPPRFKVPAPENEIVALTSVVLCVTLVDILTVPVEIVIWCLLFPPPFVKATT